MTAAGSGWGQYKLGKDSEVISEGSTEQEPSKNCRLREQEGSGDLGKNAAQTSRQKGSGPASFQ